MGFYVGNKSSPVAGFLISRGLYTSIVGVKATWWSGEPDCFGTGNSTNVSTPVLNVHNMNFDDMSTLMGNESLTPTPHPIVGLKDKVAYTYSYLATSPTVLASNVDLAVAGKSPGTFVFANNSNQTLYRHGAREYGLNEGIQLYPKSSITAHTSLTGYNEGYVGDDFLILRSANIILSMGRNTYGQLGTRDTIDRWSPTIALSVAGLTIGNYGFGVGKEHTVVIGTIGTSTVMYSWGRNTYGQLGTGDTTNRSSPAYTLLGTSSTHLTPMIVCGGHHNLLTTTITGSTSIRIVTWGKNDYGQLGLGDIVNRSVPMSSFILASDSPASRWIGATENSSFWSRATGTYYSLQLFAMGRGLYGENGNAGNDCSTPVMVREVWDATDNTPLETNTFSRYMAPSANHGILQLQAISGSKANAGMWWGRNDYGQLGLGDVINRSTPIAAMIQQVKSSQYADTFPRFFPGGQYEAVEGVTITGNTTASFAIRDNELAASGAGTLGQLGNNSVIGVSTPIALMTWGAGAPASFTASMNNFVYTFNGSTTNQWGNSGPGTSGDVDWSMTPMLTGSTWKKLILTPNLAGKMIGLKHDGTIWGWGINDNYMLGTITITNSSPQQIGSSSAWIDIGATEKAIIALDKSRNLYVWGYNLHSVFGTGAASSANYSTPVQIGTNKWLTFSTGVQHVLAIDTSGRLWGWGSSASGQLGKGNVLTVSTPVQIGTSSAWIMCWAGYQVSYAMDKTALYACGYNGNGTLGINSTTNMSVLTAVSATVLPYGNNWKKLVTGEGVTYFLEF